MDDFELIDELLELTLASQRPDATMEERARLERLLADNPQAILWYLRIVDDTLTLIDASAAHDSEVTAMPRLTGCMPQNPTTAHEAAVPLTGKPNKSRRFWMAVSSIACSLLVLAGAQWIWQSMRWPSIDAGLAVDRESARVVEVSNVEWAQGAQRFNEWGLVRPGDSLEIKSGWINLFLSGGAELLIEGPSDVQYLSPQRVFVRQGKLAARIGPGAVGFRVGTPQANVIDRGTSFGISVDGERRTSVVVYEGIVDLEALGDRGQSRRLVKGEALSIDGNGQLRRITTIESAEFLEPPKARPARVQIDRLITTVSDNVRSLETAKYYRVVPHGFREDCQAYVDRMHEWNGIDRRGLPPFLLGGDYVMTYNDDKIVREIEVAVTVSQPANLFVLIDDRISPPEWLKRDFKDTKWDVGSDEGWGDRVIDVAAGPGQSVEHVFSVWRCVVPEPTTVILGAISNESPTPAVSVERSMYGIVATPLNGDSNPEHD